MVAPRQALLVFQNDLNERQVKTGDSRSLLRARISIVVRMFGQQIPQKTNGSHADFLYLSQGRAQFPGLGGVDEEICYERSGLGLEEWKSEGAKESRGGMVK